MSARPSKGLTWGSYNLDLLADGRQSWQILIELRSGSTLYVDATLSPSASDHAPVPIKVFDEDVWSGTQFNDLAIQKLPNGRNIWSLLQGQEPSTVTDRFEIGGLKAAVLALFSAFGASWTENLYQFNGLDVTDPYVPGKGLLNSVDRNYRFDW